MPFVTIEAEDATCTGSVVGPSYGSYTDPPQVPTEASGRRACFVKEAGEYSEFTAPVSFNAIAVRYSIPDAPQGGGLTTSIALTVDGVARPDVPLTSEYSWVTLRESNSHSSDPSRPAHRPTRI